MSFRPIRREPPNIIPLPPESEKVLLIAVSSIPGALANKKVRDSDA
jgi:hypothetical protein